MLCYYSSSCISNRAHIVFSLFLKRNTSVFLARCIYSSSCISNRVHSSIDGDEYQAEDSRFARTTTHTAMCDIAAKILVLCGGDQCSTGRPRPPAPLLPDLPLAAPPVPS